MIQKELEKSTMKSKNIYIVNHTHWDREWYRSFNDFGASLKRGTMHLLNLLDRNEIENFYFDGQTIILDDLNEILPSAEFEKLLNYIRSGKIEVGPWYVLPDEGLIDYTSYKKNIDIGQRICQKYNVPSGQVMYLPDTFGHDPSIPKLASEYGMKNAIIHRGVTAEQIDVIWKQGENELRALVLPTREGYYQPMFHQENYRDRLDAYIEAYCARTSSNDILVLNGCDHTFPSDQFKLRLEEYANLHPEYNIKQVTLSEFFRQASYEFDSVITGEQRDKGIAFLLPGVLSTRQYLKYQNRQLVDLLVEKYEPLAKLLNQEDIEQLNIERLWKLIIQNQPHDSICGCSIDNVHKEMEVRSQVIYDSAHASIKELINSKYYYKINNSSFNQKLFVYNHTDAGSVNAHFSVNVPSDQYITGKTITLKSREGIVIGDIIDCKKVEKLLHDYKTEPDYQMLQEVTVECNLSIEPKEYKLYEIEFIDIDDSEKFSFDYADFISKNINYQWITDKGDTYNFDPFGEYVDFENEVIADTQHNEFHCLQIKSTAFAQRRFDFKSKQRCGEELEINILTNIKFYREGYAKVEIEIANAHENIKVINNIAKAENDIVYSDTADSIIERPANALSDYCAKDLNEEVDYNQKPTTKMFGINETLKIYHIGQNELEVLPTSIRTTLFRSVGDLSRRDLDSRKGGAGPSYATPDAQCLRLLKFNYIFNYAAENVNHLNMYELITHQFNDILSND